MDNDAITITYRGLTLRFPMDVAMGCHDGEDVKSYATISNIMARLEVYNHVHSQLGLPLFALSDVTRDAYARN